MNPTECISFFRKGRRVFCDGPWTLVFLTYEYPPDRVKWFEASKDLWKAYHLSFDNDFIRFDPTGVRKYCVTGVSTTSNNVNHAVKFNPRCNFYFRM